MPGPEPFATTLKAFAGEYLGEEAELTIMDDELLDGELMLTIQSKARNEGSALFLDREQVRELFSTLGIWLHKS